MHDKYNTYGPCCLPRKHLVSVKHFLVPGLEILCFPSDDFESEPVKISVAALFGVAAGWTQF